MTESLSDRVHVEKFMLRVFVFPIFVLAGFFISTLFDAGAQQPTQAQRDAIRASCRSDFIANCLSVKPGGKDALACLMRNEAKLSAPCKSAVQAVTSTAPAPAVPAIPAAAPEPASGAPTPESAAVPSQEDQLKAVRQACTINDFTAHCSWIAPTSPELLLCLKGNAAELSPACQSVVQSLPPPAAPAGVAAPPGEAPKPASPPTRTVTTPKPVHELFLMLGRANAERLGRKPFRTVIGSTLTEAPSPCETHLAVTPLPTAASATLSSAWRRLDVAAA